MPENGKRGLIQAWEFAPGMIVRDWYRTLGRAGKPTMLILRAGVGLGTCAGAGVGFLFRNPAKNPDGFVGWGGALGDVDYWLDEVVDLADPKLGVDLAAIEAVFGPEMPSPGSHATR